MQISGHLVNLNFVALRLVLKFHLQVKNRPRISGTLVAQVWKVVNLSINIVGLLLLAPTTCKFAAFETLNTAFHRLPSRPQLSLPCPGAEDPQSRSHPWSLSIRVWCADSMDRRLCEQQRQKSTARPVAIHIHIHLQSTATT